MPKATRLQKRRNTYYARAKVPADIQDTFGKTEVIRSLQTSDHREAQRRLPGKSAEINALFDRHREHMRRNALQAQQNITPPQLAHLKAVYHRHLLSIDERIRQGLLPPQAFDQHFKLQGKHEARTRQQYARRIPTAESIDLAQQVLTWDTVNIKLAPNSPDLLKVVWALEEATIEAGELIVARNKGNVVPTPSQLDAENTVDGDKAALLSVLVDQWISEKKRGAWVEKTAQEHKTWLSVFIEVAGDRPVTEYKKADANAFKSLLLKAPQNWMKRKETRGLSLRDAVAKGEELGIPLMSVRTVNKILTMVGSFWTWATTNIDENLTKPFAGMRIREKTDPRTQRDSFTVQQLNQLFRLPLFTGCQSRQNLKTPGPYSMRDSSRFWAPLISLFTGMRIGEIVQLHVGDIRQIDGVWVFDVNRDGEGKRLKTLSSARLIPVHDELISVGLLEHVSTRQANGETMLFADVSFGPDGYLSTSASKQFARILKNAGLKTAKLTFHSFRHTFEDGCRSSGIPFDVMNALQGHVALGMAARYGTGFDITTLSQAIRKLKYNELEITHLHHAPK